MPEASRKESNDNPPGKTPIFPGSDLTDRKGAYITFYHVLNGLLKRDNTNTYVTGSNAKISFRQNEMSHIMENVIFNELVRRGYSVDVGMVTTNPTINGVRTQATSEIDFVINKASERIYVQSAFSIPDAEKRAQETCSLRNVRDSFRKVVITGDAYETPWMDQNGILFIGLKAFLLDPHSLETL